jgi:hypothetical protein
LLTLRWDGGLQPLSSRVAVFLLLFVLHRNGSGFTLMSRSGSSTFFQRGSPPPPPWRLLSERVFFLHVRTCHCLLFSTLTPPSLGQTLAVTLGNFWSRMVFH